MFSLNDNKVFMDIVHGYISVPKLFAKWIVDTPEFQRLRFIDQTGMLPVYPTAKHDRFIHSLGVYHLGHKAADALIKNFQDSPHWNVRSDDSRYIFWGKCKILFLLACLLHDVGHAPFSHSMESFFECGNNKPQLIEELLKKLNLKTKAEEKSFLDAAEHEKMSSLIIFRSFTDRIGAVLEALGKDGFPKLEKQYYSEYDQKTAVVDSSDLEESICFIVRMIMGIKYSDYHPERQIQNCFIELLNGKNFDVDKLDYIIRDTQMSGISNITLDIERLIGALTIVPTTIFENYEFTENTIKEFDEGTFFLTLRLAKNQRVEFIGFFDSPVNLSGTVEIHPGTLFTIPANNDTNGMSAEVLNPVEFTKDSEIKVFENSVWVNRNRVTNGTISLSNEGVKSYQLKRARVTKDNAFCLEIRTNVGLQQDTSDKYGDTFESGKIVISDYTSINDFASSCYYQGEIRGIVELLEVLGDKLGSSSPSEHAYTGFTIGFKKQAVNVIPNIMEARNYLYLWIYAHHKVVYYANYLVPELSQLSHLIMDDRNLEEKFEIDYFTDSLLNESDLIAFFKMTYLKCKSGNLSSKSEKYRDPYIMLYEEFCSRRYKKSAYKSLVEYDNIFRELTKADKSSLRMELPKNSKYYGVQRDTKYGVFDTNKIDLSDLPFIKEVMWIDSSYSRKWTDISKLYIVFSKNQVINIERLPVLNTGRDNKMPESYNEYFYIYYSLDEDRANQYCKENKLDYSKINIIVLEKLKKKLLNIFPKI